jgi:hypothetical protein
LTCFIRAPDFDTLIPARSRHSINEAGGQFATWFSFAAILKHKKAGQESLAGFGSKEKKDVT